MRAAVVVFPGSNRDRDAIEALRLVTGRDPAVIWHADSELPKVDLIVVPGGFSYGDYLRCGAMAARAPAMREVVRAAAAGCHVLGICNGFQILTEAGLLPGALLRNASLRFICHNAWLRVEATNTPFTAGYRPGQTILIPVAHGDGNYFADPETFRRIEGEGLVAFRYSDAAGDVGHAANPNGSLANVAGIFNETRTVLGLMPHPECAVDPLVGCTDGRPMFEALAEALG